MKKIILTGLLLMLLLLLCACTKNNSKETDIQMSSLYNEIAKNIDLQTLTELEYDYFSNIYITEDFNQEIIKDYAIYEEQDPLKVDTIILLKLDSQENIDKVVQILENIKEQKMSANANGYNPEQYDLASKGVIDSKGKIVYLIISDKNEDIIQIINNR